MQGNVAYLLLVFMFCTGAVRAATPSSAAGEKEIGAVRHPVPDALTMRDGRKVTSVAMWEKERRPEILDLFRRHCFGYNPVERPANQRFESIGEDTVMMDGAAVRKRARICFSGPGGVAALRVLAFFPSAAKGPVPAFLMIVNASGERKHWADETRAIRHEAWPVEEIIRRGYATVCYFVSDLDPDYADGFTNGVHRVFGPAPASRTESSWGGLAAWAWGAGRVMDWMETQPAIDAARVAVIGWSRGGKTALWAGANDTRFALVISNDSGCGGAKLNRMNLPDSEHIREITKNIGYWFCDHYKSFSGQEDKLPFDQHELIALMAPRRVYIASAVEDLWAGPQAEFMAAKLASSVWTLYGKRGLDAGGFPQPETAFHEGNIGYHLASGRHRLGPYDWACYLDYADRYFLRKDAVPKAP